MYWIVKGVCTRKWGDLFARLSKFRRAGGGIHCYLSHSFLFFFQHTRTCSAFALLAMDNLKRRHATPNNTEIVPLETPHFQSPSHHQSFSAYDEKQKLYRPALQQQPIVYSSNKVSPCLSISMSFPFTHFITLKHDSTLHSAKGTNAR